MKKLLVTTAIITILAGCNADDVQDNVNQLNDFTEPQSRKASGILYSATVSVHQAPIDRKSVTLST